jgi:5-methyltetrahydrofolate--homocysteine methyltransferase
LAKKYGAALLCLTLDDAGIPDKAEGRVEVAEKILDRALALGIKREDLVVDCLAMAVSADPSSAKETIRTIRLVKEKLGLTTVLGVSNVSFGLPARVNINSHFLSMAFSAGLDSAIVNPLNERVMDAYHASLVLVARDPRAGGYIKRFGNGATAPAKKAPAKKEKPEDIFSRLAKAVIEGGEDSIENLVEEALSQKIDPLKISEQGLIAGLDEVGRLFKTNRYFLPQVILSADTMKKGFERVKLAMDGRKGPKRGKVLMATVEGDIHDIGKNIVTTLLENYGFEVMDLGKNVPAARIVEEAKKEGADVVALSALMTTTVTEMENVIKKLKAGGVKARTVVGGAVVTEEFARRIGADEYGGEAVEAVEKIKRLVGEKN